jgi:SAM-dependent methyltransferase
VLRGGGVLSTLEEALRPYRSEDYVEAFERYRRLPESLLRWYAHDLLAAAPRDGGHRILRFLDVGAGIGQFASALDAEAARQGVNLHLTLLEPSPAFARRLAQTRFGGHAVLAHQRLEDLQPSAGFDLVLASEIAHVFESHALAFDALSELLAEGGVAALRYSTKAQVQDRNWYEFVPAAADVDLARAPAEGEYEELLAERGFEVSAVEVDESRDLSPAERLGIVAARAYSSYRLVDEDAFERGVQQLTDAITRGTMSICWKSRMTWTKARLHSAG